MKGGLDTLFTLGRVSNLPTVWMNVLTAGVLVGSGWPGRALGWPLLALSALYCGGMALNDYFDRHVDGREQPFRPIPAGKISPDAALAWAIGLLAGGWLLLLLAPAGSGAWRSGLLLVFVIWAYDRFHKKYAQTVFLMAAARALVYPTTAWALGASWPEVVWIAAAAAFLWTLAITVAARIENAREDRWGFPVIPWMIAGLSVVDGALLAIFVSPPWLLAGILATLLTRLGQQRIRGD